MTVTPCDWQERSAIDPAWVKAADYRDAYRVALSRPDMTVEALFFAVFGHRPPAMKAVMLLRNQVAAIAGLETSRATDVLQPQVASTYAVGDRIGGWPIFHLSGDELVAGRDNAHMDFRLSVMKIVHAGEPAAVFATVCDVHNRFGAVYLATILPFHKWGVRKLISNAAEAGRL